MEINYRRALTIGIPLVRLFVDPMNRLLDRLQVGRGPLSPIFTARVHFHDKAYSYVKYRPIWVMTYSSISTESWTDWPRHRKVIASPFHESIMGFVWNESLGQARDMPKVWTEAVKPGSISLAKDTRTLSLNVLAATACRKSYKFRLPIDSETSALAALEASSYRDALQTVLDNLILIMLVPARLYMDDVHREETLLFGEGKGGNGSLMAAFVRALGASKREATVENPQRASKCLASSMIPLATHPEVQDWVLEELQSCPYNFPSKYMLHVTYLTVLGGRKIVTPPRTGIIPYLFSYPRSDFASRLKSEYVVIPVQSTFFPWLDGPQNCPGRKFSQVEFLATLAVLLRSHRVSAVLTVGETAQEAKERALIVTQGCTMKLLLRMQHADQVRLASKKV
ncbi:hypothetical protein B0O99DRAFT_655953 [Bisporella sp. PMI_857]|nr:hypothetical protein B0O99DRAFT_655953 [Bisporella sp. PMI_857]